MKWHDGLAYMIVASLSRVSRSCQSLFNRLILKFGELVGKDFPLRRGSIGFFDSVGLKAPTGIPQQPEEVVVSSQRTQRSEEPIVDIASCEGFIGAFSKESLSFLVGMDRHAFFGLFEGRGIHQPMHFFHHKRLFLLDLGASNHPERGLLFMGGHV